MISYYLKKFKKLNLESITAFLKTQGLFISVLDILIIVLSFQISLFLRLGEEFSQFSTAAILFNTCIYALFGISISVGKHIYKDLWQSFFLDKFNPIVVSVILITLLYIPVMFLVPEEYSISSSTPFINGFVLTALLWTAHHFYRLKRQSENHSEPDDETVQIPLQQGILEGLLKGSSLNPDKKQVEALIKGKRVLITGAGGTFGSELIRQMIYLSPSHLCLVDNNEHLLYMADLEVREQSPKLMCEAILGDVACRERIRHVISMFKPDLVIHDAALKQVPFGETNPSQAVLTNVIGTRNVADACRDFKVKAMLLTSSHKASNPLNIMGATKRLAEAYCQVLDILERKKPSGTRYVCVRFGNILEAPGSVVPLFRRQIEKGGPLTITHPDIMRNFIPIQEAVQLSLHAMTLAVNLETKEGKIFSLGKGESIKIIDLARDMISLTGHDIEIKFVGLRPGEKILEESPAEQLLPTSHSHIFVTSPRTMDHGFLARALLELEMVAKNQDKDSILRLLYALVPEYKKGDSLEETQQEMSI